MKLFIKFLSLTIFILSLSLQAMAQTSFGALRGIVTDARGGTVTGARVVLLYYNKLAMRESRTNERGEFAFDNLRPGDYTIAVEAEGLTQSGGAQPIKIEAGSMFRIMLPLTVAAIEDSVIVSASRTESQLRETPASAYIVSVSDLMRSQQINVSDTLRTSPGVSATQSARRGGLTSLFVRGGESDYTKVMIDGIPINDAGGSFNFADLTTDNMDRIELVRGAQSAIYGSDAMSGVLQLFTHRGTTTTPALEFVGEGGSFAFNRQLARISGLHNAFDYSFSYTNLHTDGRDRNDDYQNRIATANIGYRFSERTQFRLTAQKYSSGLGVPGPTLMLYPDPDERSRRKHIILGARLDDQTSNFWHQSLTFAYSESNALSFDPVAQDLSKPNTPRDTVFAFNNHQRRRGLRYQSDFVLAGGHFLTAGIDYDQEAAVFDNGFNGADRVASDRTNLGAYIQDQFTFSNRLFITAGVRLEHNKSDLPASFAKTLSGLGSAAYSGKVGFGSEIVPKIAAIYVLRQSGIQSRRGPTNLKVNYGEGIKAPTLVEAFSPSQYFLGNPALKPERSRNFDFGVEQYFWKDRIRIEGIYFDNRYRNQIAFVGNPATFGGPVKLADGRMTNFINYDRTRARGFELTVAWHPKRWFNIGGNYTLLDTKLIEAADVIDYSVPKSTPNPEIGLPLLRRPRHSGSVNAFWIREKYDLGVIGVMVGERRDLDPVTSSHFDLNGRPFYNKGYAKFDLVGSYRITKWMRAFARVENVLNRNYQEVLGYPAYRLNFSAGVRFRFGGKN